ncbi:hypothetical protein BT63DRAFT_420723 [Microthyrium microscopicum]|uniref:Uncharacterized protein n=1 Tax=Microthyrium microscopicum TaxID=703497 RepID=A0A6A6UVU5_9PEZI|nr:hypothetical protein BT63DRAFT_420723 [Microthyrium microscopicum]
MSKKVQAEASADNAHFDALTLRQANNQSQPPENEASSNAIVGTDSVPTYTETEQIDDPEDPPPDYSDVASTTLEQLNQSHAQAISHLASRWKGKAQIRMTTNMHGVEVPELSYFGLEKDDIRVRELKEKAKSAFIHPSHSKTSITRNTF